MAKDKDEIAISEHEGWKITFHPHHKRFHIISPKGGELDGVGWFDTLRQAEEAIDNRNKNAMKAKRKPLNFEVLNADGETVVIHGIHAGKGELLSKGKLTYDLFPVVPWIEDLLVQRVELDKKMKAISTKLRAFSFKFDTYRYDPNNGESWEAAVGKLTDQIEGAKARADKFLDEIARKAVEEQKKEKAASP